MTNPSTLGGTQDALHALGRGLGRPSDLWIVSFELAIGEHLRNVICELEVFLERVLQGGRECLVVLDLSELLRSFPEDVADPPQQLLAMRRSQPPPVGVIEGSPSTSYRPLDVLNVAVGDGTGLLAGCWIARVNVLPDAVGSHCPSISRISSETNDSASGNNPGAAVRATACTSTQVEQPPKRPEDAERGRNRNRNSCSA